MQAVEADGDWNLIRRTDGGVAKTIKAQDLWDRISNAAWSCADPGCNSIPPSMIGIRVLRWTHQRQ